MKEKKIEKEFEELKNIVITSQRARDELEMYQGIPLWKIKNLLTNFKTLYYLEKSYKDFQTFCIEELGRGSNQTIRAQRVGNYLKEQGVSISDVKNIPITKLEILAKNKVRWTDDVYHDVTKLGYNYIKINYDKKKNTKKDNRPTTSID